MAKSLQNTPDHVEATYRIEDPRDRGEGANSAWFPKLGRHDSGVTHGGKAAQQPLQEIANSFDA